MKLTVAQSIFSLCPDAMLGLVFVERCNNKADMMGFAGEQKAIEEEVRKQFPTAEAVGKDKRIQAWRRAYRAFGCDPHDYRCSSEALTRQVVKGNNIWGINPLVDCYNYISLKYTVPVGGEDADKVVGDVELRRAVGDEAFIRLGGTENEPPEPGEVIYADEAGVLCRRWNWREADRTKLTAETTRAILVIETIHPMTRETVEAATTDLAALVEKWCGAQTKTAVLDRSQPSVEF